MPSIAVLGRAKEMSVALLLLLRDNLSQGGERRKGDAQQRVPPFHVSPQDCGERFRLCFYPRKEDTMADTSHKEEYTYQVGKITFIVSAVYKENGESMEDILLKLMMAEVESV